MLEELWVCSDLQECHHNWPARGDGTFAKIRKVENQNTLHFCAYSPGVRKLLPPPRELTKHEASN